MKGKGERRKEGSYKGKKERTEGEKFHGLWIWDYAWIGGEERGGKGSSGKGRMERDPSSRNCNLWKDKC